MKILNLTHCDLDGVACALSIRAKYGKENVDVFYCNYSNINGSLYNVLKEEPNKYDLIYITDISISEKMAKWVDASFKNKVILIDHHINSATEHLNQYDWVKLRENKRYIEEKTSACYLVYDFLSIDDENFGNPVLEDVIHNSDLWDTWLWKTKYNVTKPRDLNAICTILGFDRFIEEVEKQMKDKKFIFEITENLQLMLDLQNEDIDRYVKVSEKNMYVKKYNGLKIGFYYGEKYASEVCNILCELYPELDVVGCINMRTGVSLRTINPDIHLGELAKSIGEAHGLSGAGYKSASGVTLTNEFKNIFVDILIK